MEQYVTWDQLLQFAILFTTYTAFIYAVFNNKKK